MRLRACLLPLLLTACSRELVDETYYAPTEVEVVVALSDGDERLVAPATTGEIDGWAWSWQQRTPELVTARPSAPDGAATVARAAYASAPVPAEGPAVALHDVAVERLPSGEWRTCLRLSYRAARGGAVWSQRLRLDADADGVWTVDLGRHPLTGQPHHAVVRVGERSGRAAAAAD